jgi:hypothetical protein
LKGPDIVRIADQLTYVDTSSDEASAGLDPHTDPIIVLGIRFDGSDLERLRGNTDRQQRVQHLF